MNRLIYFGVFSISMVLLAGGALFMCAAMAEPQRLWLAIVLLAFGLVGAGWSAWAYRKWASVQPATLAARVTDLAAQNEGELALVQVMSAFDVPASVAQAALDELRDKGQCHQEARGERIVFVFPGLKQHKVVRKCAYCGSTFPVKQSLQKCSNCGGKLEVVKE